MRFSEREREEIDELQEHLWNLIGERDRDHLITFDERRDSVLDAPARINLMAAVSAINELCAEFEAPQEGFVAALERFRETRTLPPDIAFFVGYDRAALAVTSLEAYELYPDSFSIGLRKEASGRLLRAFG